MSRQIMNLEEIQAEIAKLQAKADELKAREKETAITSILNLVAEYGISFKELKAASHVGNSVGGKAKATKTKTRKQRVDSGLRLSPKYQHPHSGQTWTGRGRVPRWLVEEESRGANRSDFLIDIESTGA